MAVIHGIEPPGRSSRGGIEPPSGTSIVEAPRRSLPSVLRRTMVVVAAFTLVNLFQWHVQHSSRYNDRLIRNDPIIAPSTSVRNEKREATTSNNKLQTTNASPDPIGKPPGIQPPETSIHETKDEIRDDPIAPWTIRKKKREATTSNKLRNNNASPHPPAKLPGIHHHEETSRPPETSGHETEDKDEIEPPVWSVAYAVKHEHDARASELRWKSPPGLSVNPDDEVQRDAIELLAYGLGMLLPYYHPLLPRLRFDPPFVNTTRVEIAMVPGLVDALPELHECTIGRYTDTNGTVTTDGVYTVCFPPDFEPGRDAREDHCPDKPQGEGLLRNHYYPLGPGRELWSCRDTALMEQYVGALVLDYFLELWDRFMQYRNNNIFFLKASLEHPPVKLVHIDHHKGDRLGDYQSYESWVKTKILLEQPLPQALADDLVRLRRKGTKEGLRNALNASLQHQLEGLNEAIMEPKYQHRGFHLTDYLWRKMESVLHYYNVTTDA